MPQDLKIDYKAWKPFSGVKAKLLAQTHNDDLVTRFSSKFDCFFLDQQTEYFQDRLTN